MKRNKTRECECGRSKKSTSAACSHCQFLDGHGAAEIYVIDILRTAGGYTEYVRIQNAWNRSNQQLARTIKVLIQRGRVQRLEQDAVFYCLVA